MTQRLPDRRRWLRVALLIAATALGAFLRLYRIGELPPALGYDAAYYGVDALNLLRGEPPGVMCPDNREPLFSYLVAGSFFLLGPSAGVIHVTSAVIGILTIPAVFAAADALFQGSEGPLRNWAPPLASLVMALSYWHLNWSRIGLRAILVPLFSAATMASLWRGLRGGRRRDFTISGIWLGLSLYTYQAARLLPLLVVVSLLVQASRQGKLARALREQLPIVALVSLLLFAPLGIHFLTHPGSFSQRVEEAFVVESDQGAAANLRAILDQTVETVLAFNFAGDETPYSTIPGRPSLNPFLSALFFLGIGASLLSVRKSPHPTLLVWLVMMSVPATLAGKGPTAKRAIGALPAVAMLIALGALAPWTPLRRWRRAGDRTPAMWFQRAWIVILLGGLAWTGFITYRDYFVVWAANPNLPTHFEAPLSSIGAYIGDLPHGEQVYLSPELPRHPAIRFHSGLREDVRGYNGRVCFVAPIRTPADTTYVIVPGEGDHSLEWLQACFPEGQRTGPDAAAGVSPPPFVPYRVSAGTEASLKPAHPIEATWADAIRFLGYDLDGHRYQPGDTISLTLFYLDVTPMEQRYTAFVHLLGPTDPATGSPLRAQSDSEPCAGFYPTTSWHAGEMLMDRIELHVPEDARGGTYSLGTGFYDIWTGERLPLASLTAPTDNDSLILTDIEIAARD